MFNGEYEMSETVDCELCGTQTDFIGTNLCDRCWELDHRVKADPEIAGRILEGIKGYAVMLKSRTTP